MVKAKWLPTKKVYDQYGIEKRKQRELIRSGRLEAIDIGCGDRPSYLVSVSSLESLLESLRVKADA